MKKRFLSTRRPTPITPPFGMTPSKKFPSIGVDECDVGGTDPTKNVTQLVDAAVRRLDDLRESAKELSDVKIAHQKEVGLLREHCQNDIGTIREEHSRELAIAESGRLNSIRQVDREEVAKTAAAAQMAIATLAATTNTMAETLRTQVATVALAAESRQGAFAGDVNKRLSALELSSSEGKGKQQVADPQMDRLAAMVEKMAATQATGTGKGEGLQLGWVILLGAVGLIGSLLGIAGVLYAVLKP